MAGTSLRRAASGLGTSGVCFAFGSVQKLGSEELSTIDRHRIRPVWKYVLMRGGRWPGPL